MALAVALTVPSGLATVAATGAAAQAAQAAKAAQAAPVAADVRMNVLVLDDGQPMVGAIIDRLAIEGVPVTRVNLADAARPAITSEFLVSRDAAGAHGRYAGVVAPSEAPQQLSAAERTLLHEYEQTFKVRSVAAYTWAHPEVGLNYAGYVGKVDGMTATVTDAGASGPFNYLAGQVALDDVDASVNESWGYLATPLTPTATSGTFSPLVTAAIPGTGEAGSLIGVHSKDGREQLVLTFAQNASQQHWRTFGHGIVNWLTRGVSTSMNRNYLSVHIDDVLLGDARWSTAGNCTSGDDCPANVTEPDIRMTAGDVTRLTDWQHSTGIKLDMVFNGAGTAEHAPTSGTDALTSALLQAKNQLRWINHTWSHPYLGCIQDFTATPWSCAKSATGSTRWASSSTIADEIRRNTGYARLHKLPVDTAELVTGQHSGLKTLPQMPADNPNLAESLQRTGIRWIGADASREAEPRRIGPATTVPRYPMNIYYNTGTKAEAADEYNWIYTSGADGGSGVCTQNPAVMTCIPPLNPTTGFDSYIVPIEARIALSHVLNNDARPHYAHQSNLAEDGVLYPVLDKVINQYKATFAANTPLINPAMGEAGQQLLNQQHWTAGQGAVSMVVSGTSATIRNSSGATVLVPVTVPAGTTSATGAIGVSYAGQVSGWNALAGGGTLRLGLPGDSGFATSVTWPAEPDAPALTPDPKVQVEGVTTEVPLPEPNRVTGAMVGQQP